MIGLRISKRTSDAGDRNESKRALPYESPRPTYTLETRRRGPFLGKRRRQTAGSVSGPNFGWLCSTATRVPSGPCAGRRECSYVSSKAPPMFGKDEIPLPAPIEGTSSSSRPRFPRTSAPSLLVRAQNHVAQEPREQESGAVGVTARNARSSHMSPRDRPTRWRRDGVRMPPERDPERVSADPPE